MKNFEGLLPPIKKAVRDCQGYTECYADGQADYREIVKKRRDVLLGKVEEVIRKTSPCETSESGVGTCGEGMCDKPQCDKYDEWKRIYAISAPVMTTAIKKLFEGGE